MVTPVPAAQTILLLGSSGHVDSPKGKRYVSFDKKQFRNVKIVRVMVMKRSFLSQSAWSLLPAESQVLAQSVIFSVEDFFHRDNIPVTEAHVKSEC